MIRLKESEHRSHVIAAGMLSAQYADDSDGVMKLMASAMGNVEDATTLVLALLEMATVWGLEAANNREMTPAAFLTDWLEFCHCSREDMPGEEVHLK